MSIEVVQCVLPDAVDLMSSGHLPEDEVLHCSATEWSDFVAAVKAGSFDHLTSAGLFRQETG